MCVAGLNVSIKSCNHRWYELRTPCHPANHLNNCPERLRLEGWETRNEHCPWCDAGEQTLHVSTHRLFGSSSTTSPASSSPASPELSALTRSRSGSTGTLSSLSRHSSSASMDSERGQRHREMNDRLHAYMTNHPHELLPSARKNYPSTPSSPVEEVPGSDVVSVRSAGGGGAVGKGWKKSVRFSMGMFKD
ncbi:hypothetical protein LTR91_008040 [Friedmanniomyces endolithicus]|uniref:Uncharacterized protein n=1 Tax=Friedmanniomyces endolithicus TaxID=329885 RepID=A0AAN6KPQ2_9PEZI|nr:hypothetical protein LTR73_008263 [Friedmanniomyces endolithicus]KAK0930209.1 hypothetical protein LTR57_001377 [Friedmanniomyces endolithicus]KAK0934695.1 hypothetical protein LTR29_013701 [Friedmanniomyces endolithicus]KAK0992423.1 hypothetical protein LTS01_007818 [Friedmanniomyces endolithicus]KAK0993249.1 hypothetical protein LTR91_008040 [Friedmanniomyces endolithicus]